MTIKIVKNKTMEISEFVEKHDLTIEVRERFKNNYDNDNARYCAQIKGVSYEKVLSPIATICGNGYDPDVAINDLAFKISGLTICLSKNKKLNVEYELQHTINGGD